MLAFTYFRYLYKWYLPLDYGKLFCSFYLYLEQNVPIFYHNINYHKKHLECDYEFSYILKIIWLIESHPRHSISIWYLQKISFYHIKSCFIYDTIPFYNTPNISFLNYLIYSLKYYFHQLFHCLVLHVKAYFHQPSHHNTTTNLATTSHHQPPHNQLTWKNHNQNQNSLISKSKLKPIHQTHNPPPLKPINHPNHQFSKTPKQIYLQSNKKEKKSTTMRSMRAVNEGGRETEG